MHTRDLNRPFASGKYPSQIRDEDVTDLTAPEKRCGRDLCVGDLSAANPTGKF